MQVLGWLVVAAATLTACTRNNPDFCCLDAADCSSEGVEAETRLCETGLACVDHACVTPSCDNVATSCAAEAPVCETTTDTCVGCSNAMDCTRFPGALACDPASGSCVECVENADCPTASPFCDANQCRACVLDTECDSAACGNDGQCVVEAAAIYVAPIGVDEGACPRTAKCKTLSYAVSQLTSARSHIVLDKGNYSERGVRVESAAAASATIHGHNAVLNGGNSDYPAIHTFIPTTIRDLEVTTNAAASAGIYSLTTLVLERVVARGRNAIVLSGQTTARDIEAVGVSGSSNEQFGLSSALTVRGSLSLDRARIHGGTNGLEVRGSIEATNVLVYGTDSTAVVLLEGSSGEIRFATVAPATLTANASNVSCTTTNVQFSSSILWGYAGGSATSDQCSVSNFIRSIVGPVSGLTPGVGTWLNADPLFVSVEGRDYHLMPNSPARDFADLGPATDVDGSPRPSGPKFDLGAFEAQ